MIVNIPCRLKFLPIHKGECCGDVGEVVECRDGMPRKGSRRCKLLNDRIYIAHRNEEYDVLTVFLHQCRQRAHGQTKYIAARTPQYIVAVCGDGDPRRRAPFSYIFSDKARAEDHDGASFPRQRIIYEQSNILLYGKHCAP